MEEITINATMDQIEEFLESVLWQDIKNELDSWKMGFNAEMMSIVDEAADTNPSTASVLLHMGDLNGRQKAVDYIRSLPEMLLQILKDKKEDKESDNPNLEVS